jgi:hypothetical protein
MRVVSKLSSRLKGGKIVGNRWASIVFPVPGEPMNRTLCPPAAATTKPRLAYSCPRTS